MDDSGVGLQARMEEWARVAGFSPAPIEETIARAHAVRTRRRTRLAVAGSVAIALAIGGASILQSTRIGEGQGTDSVLAKPDTPTSSASPQSPSPPSFDPPLGLGPTTACSKLPKLSRGVEIDTVLAREFRQLMISFTDPNSAKGNQLEVIINYGKDPTCRQRADIRRVLKEALRS